MSGESPSGCQGVARRVTGVREERGQSSGLGSQTGTGRPEVSWTVDRSINVTSGGLLFCKTPYMVTETAHSVDQRNRWNYNRKQLSILLMCRTIRGVRKLFLPVSLFCDVCQVVGDLMMRIHRIPDFTAKLLLVRKRLLGLEPEGITYVCPVFSEVF